MPGCRSADASICYTLFGVLGTMAGSYVLFVPKADEKMPRKISAILRSSNNNDFNFNFNFKSNRINNSKNNNKKNDM
eukprot:4494733-Amphidinium_carterae.1